MIAPKQEILENSEIPRKVRVRGAFRLSIYANSNSIITIHIVS